MAQGPPIRGRFAPSPTGRMHVGNARTALLAWLAARATGGTMVMRIEDLDRSRCRPAYEASILDDLRWLGLDWDEGPDVGGPHGPYRQSEREEAYEAALARLDVFSCTCTRRELRDVAGAPEGAEPVYPGVCRDGPRRPGRPAALRWRVPPGIVEVPDAIEAPLRQDVHVDVGDFVVRRNDGAWAYQLAVVVDDAAMEITDVVRGADLWVSTPRQVWLQRALGVPTPRYAHVPLVEAGGIKLSKRRRPVDLGALRAAGVDPRWLVARLATSAGIVGPEVERIRPPELLDAFALDRISKSTTGLHTLGLPEDLVAAAGAESDPMRSSGHAQRSDRTPAT